MDCAFVNSISIGSLDVSVVAFVGRRTDDTVARDSGFRSPSYSAGGGCFILVRFYICSRVVKIELSELRLDV